MGVQIEISMDHPTRICGCIWSWWFWQHIWESENLKPKFFNLASVLDQITKRNQVFEALGRGKK